MACLGMKSDTKNRNSISVTIPASLEVPADHQLTNHNPGDHNRRNVPCRSESHPER